VHVVCWFANQVKHLEGDFVECGVNTGAYARAIVEYIDFNSLGKTFYLLDTFEGLVPSQITEEEAAVGVSNYLQAYTDVYEQVKTTFSGFNVKIIKGMVPDTLPLVTSSRIAYLSIDMNVLAPEIAAMEYFWDKIVPGGVLIHDDYGFPQHIHQKHAVDAFAQARGLEVLCLPTGQGILLKPVHG
jgi:O-methyltransferase